MSRDPRRGRVSCAAFLDRADTGFPDGQGRVEIRLALAQRNHVGTLLAQLGGTRGHGLGLGGADGFEPLGNEGHGLWENKRAHYVAGSRVSGNECLPNASARDADAVRGDIWQIQ